MSFVAIVGAGPIGAAIAHRLTQRPQPSPTIVLIDAADAIAAGKALDIRQAGPIEGSDTPVTATPDVLAACGASVVVMADDIKDGEWTGDRGLTLIRRLVRAGTSAAFVFAGPQQTPLMEAVHRDLSVPAARLVGSAPAAIVGAVQALAGLELNAAGVQVAVVGRPPEFVIGWSSACVGGSLLTDRIPPHRLAAIGRSVARLWPAGPYAIASATARIVEGLISGSRVPIPGTAIIDDGVEARGAGVLLPLELGRLRVLSRLPPSLSPQERTQLVNGLGVAG
ncbi:MAG: hypothetical protein IT184_00090 [Acidobacteria bacterium]|nr:hypothetical protein [Acidobacteriota bacterium]